MPDSLGDRIKRYEAVYAPKLTPRSCLFVRVDGKAFHTFTKGLERPFSQTLMDAMVVAAEDTAAGMQGFKLGYVQSDEATFCLTDFDTHQTQGWFGYELNKVVSISASMMTAYFNAVYGIAGTGPALFDSRAFTAPLADAPNVFIWRQKDWHRNSLQMLARAHFSHKELNGKNAADMHEMLHSVGVNWARIDSQHQNGTFLYPDHTTSYTEKSYDEIMKLLVPEGDLG